MSLRTQIAASMALVTLLSVGVFAYFFWFKDSDVRRVATLQQQLLDGDNLSRTERNAVKTQLMRTVDEMNPEKRRELQRDMLRQQRERMLSAAAEYRIASDTEKIAILDRELDQWQRSREVGASLFGGGPRGGGMRGMRGGGGGGGRGNRAAQEARANRSNPGSRDNRRGDRSDLTDEQRAQFAQYMQALQARAEELGIRFGQRGNGPPRQGRPPNGGQRRNPGPDAKSTAGV